MPAIDCLDEIEISATPARIYALVSDYPGWQDWNPLYRCELIDAVELEEGVQVQHTYGYPMLVLSSFVRRIDRVVPGECLEESYIDGDLIGTGVWRFEATGDKTRLSYHCKVRSNTFRAHVSLALAGGRGHSNVYQSMFKKVKALCEAPD